MWIKTLKYMMVNRTVTPRDTVIKTDQAHGAPLVRKGHAIEVESPQVAVAKPETAKSKVAKQAVITDKAD